MKSVFLMLFLVSGIFARVDTLKSTVSRWDDLKGIMKANVEKKEIMSGKAFDLEWLTVYSESIPAGIKVHFDNTHSSLEELIIVKEGMLSVSINEESKILGPGSIAMIHPGDNHSFENQSKAEVTYYVFQYKASADIDLKRGKDSGGSFMLDWNEVEYKKSQIGGRRDFFHRPTAMLNNFEMHVSTLNEGLTNHPAHTHGAEEFVVMINGDVVMLIGAENYECSTGDVIFLSSMTPHSLNNSGTGETIYFAFQFWQ